MNARPWYRWHWLTFELLLVTGIAIAYLQVFHSLGWQFGWPFVCIDREWPLRSLWDATWYPFRALANIVFCVAILVSTAFCTDHLLRTRFRLHLGSVLMFIMAAALAFSWAGWEYDATSHDGFESFQLASFLPPFVSTAWAPLPIRIIIWTAIACAFNVIGWGVVRFSVRCARLVSRRLSADT